MGDKQTDKERDSDGDYFINFMGDWPNRNKLNFNLINFGSNFKLLTFLLALYRKYNIEIFSKYCQNYFEFRYDF